MTQRANGLGRNGAVKRVEERTTVVVTGFRVCVALLRFDQSDHFAAFSGIAGIVFFDLQLSRLRFFPPFWISRSQEEFKTASLFCSSEHASGSTVKDESTIDLQTFRDCFNPSGESDQFVVHSIFAEIG